MTAANGAAPSRGEAMPFVLNSKFIEKNIEAKISLPSGAHVLSSYKRYYSTEQVVKGRKYIMGTFIHDAVGAGIQIVGPDEHPRVFDGGCDVISVRYSIASRRILSVRCNGVG